MQQQQTLDPFFYVREEDINVDELFVMRQLPMLATMGLFVLVVFCGGCAVTCVCGPEACAYLYKPCVRGICRPLLWPLYCWLFAFSVFREYVSEARHEHLTRRIK